ncbi:MAG: hypothetical protein R3E68_19955 [Burkholderiaceae bacterium]
MIDLIREDVRRDRRSSGFFMIRKSGVLADRLGGGVKYVQRSDPAMTVS